MQKKGAHPDAFSAAGAGRCHVAGDIDPLDQAMGENPSTRNPRSRRRILVVDDHPLVRRGLTALIDGESDLVVCAQAAGYEDGLAAVVASQPDLVLVDLSLDGESSPDGFELIADIRSGHGSLPILVLSMHDAPVYADRALAAGANGFASKTEMGEALLVSIRRVLAGDA